MSIIIPSASDGDNEMSDKDFDNLPLDTESALNNIKLLLAASMVLEGTEEMKSVGFQLNEYVLDYVGAVIDKNWPENNK